MNEKITIYNEDFCVNKDEFNKKPHDEFNNLNILNSLGEQERLISLLKELGKLSVDEKFDLLCIEPTHGGYIPIKVSESYKIIKVLSFADGHSNNIIQNIDNFKVENIILFEKIENINQNGKHIIFANNYNHINQLSPEFIVCSNSSIFTNTSYHKFSLLNSDFSIYVHVGQYNNFLREFHYFIESDNILNYDNLIHLCMIVKDAGDSFENVLTENLKFIDRWTIVDTGSSDNTIEIIKKVLKNKKGNLYEEPFINFRDSRNRCLDLAGKDCKYLLTLDDTYILKQNLRTFLNTIRGDQFADTFSMFIYSNDLIYSSNRILRSITNIRYKYKLHEVLDPKDNINVIIPENHANIFDFRSDYMENRTMTRKKYDLKILFEMIHDDPNDSRAYYYIGQTYNLLEDYERAHEYFMKRVEHPDEGFLQEKIDACFEAARIRNFKLNRPWNECEALYNRSYEMDKTRPESLYFIGIHYYLEKRFDLAFDYMKRAHKLGFPIHCQYGLKPTLSFYFLPKFLAELAFMFEDYKLARECVDLFMLKNQDNNSSDYYSIKAWKKILDKLSTLDKYYPLVVSPYKKALLVFVADGGFNKWSGSDILNKPVGGSETFIIEMARNIQKIGCFQCIVFCQVSKEETFEGVEYKSLDKYTEFIVNNNVHTVIISRYPEFLPLTYKGLTKNVYMLFQDLLPTGEIVINDPKLKKIFCLSDWAVENFNDMFQSLSNKTCAFGYGVDFSLNKIVKKIPRKFIYSSFPNRGLYPLLIMWSKIIERYADASLYIHCDINNEWINIVKPDEMREIKKLIKEYLNNDKYNIHYQGFTPKQELYDNWLTADIWFYPSSFLETFCLSALESAISRTLIITSDLGALKNTVADRGILLSLENGDSYTENYQQNALETLFDIMENETEKNRLIQKNYEWTMNKSWRNRSIDFLKIILTSEEYKYIIEPSLNVKDIEETNTIRDVNGIKNVDSRLNYANMYGFSNDLPEGSLDIFKNVIDNFNIKHKNKHTQILEVGTYSGVSLIKILSMIPNSSGTAIDSFKNYNEENLEMLQTIEENKIEEIFYKNIKSVGFQDKVRLLKGDSFEILLDLNKQDEKYDFIYLDGSHTCFNVYSDLILCWSLLNNGGIIAIDDYIYLKDKVLDSPYESVKFFMKKFEKEIKILNIGYRVFIEKI